MNIKIEDLPVVRFFWKKSFFHYIWSGGIFTVLNIFLIWLFIDILKISTLISSIVVIGGLFIFRYIVYRILNVM